MEEKLRDILGETAGLTVPAAGLGVEQDLFAVGLTSFATVAVMLAIEDGFDLEFPDSLLTRETFRSMASLMTAITDLNGGRLAA